MGVTVDLALSLFVQYGYWIVFVAIVLDNAGLPIPGELLLLLFGALAQRGDLNPMLGLLVGTAAAVSGDSIGYWLGRLAGDRVLRAYCRITLGSGTCIPKAVGYYERWGTATVIAGRFVIGLRVFLAPLAGAAGVPYRRFLLLDGVGALLWSGAFILIGFVLGGRLDSVHEGYRAGSLTLVAMLAAGFGGYVLMKLWRRRRHGPAAFLEPMIARAAAGLRPRRVSAERLHPPPAGPAPLASTTSPRT